MGRNGAYRGAPGAKVRDLGAHDPLAPIRGEQLAAAPLLISTGAARGSAPCGRQNSRAGRELSQACCGVRLHRSLGGVWTPQVFWKPSSSLLRPGGTVALRTKNVFLTGGGAGVVIGKQARDVKAEDAMHMFFGYTIVNDLSERKYNADIEHRDKRSSTLFRLDDGQMVRRLGSAGPELVTADEIADPSNLDLRLWLNGELMQDSNTRNMIFHILRPLPR